MNFIVEARLMYTIKLRRCQSGKNGTTRYHFPVRMFAILFACGYQAALKDADHPKYYVSVYDEKGELVKDAPELKRMVNDYYV